MRLKSVGVARWISSVVAHGTDKSGACHRGFRIPHAWNTDTPPHLSMCCYFHLHRFQTRSQIKPQRQNKPKMGMVCACKFEGYADFSDFRFILKNLNIFWWIKEPVKTENSSSFQKRIRNSFIAWNHLSLNHRSQQKQFKIIAKSKFAGKMHIYGKINRLIRRINNEYPLWIVKRKIFSTWPFCNENPLKNWY